MAVSGAANAGVVIKSSGPSASQYPVGKKLDDAGRIVLKAGDSVTVLADGGTRVISGAGTHRVAERGISKRSTFAALTRERSKSRVRTGATRGQIGDETLSRSSIWYVDVSQSGTMCVSDMSAVRMWRPGREQDSTYVIASASSPEHVHVSFPKDVMIADWDAALMPLSDGAEFSITGPGGEPVTLKFAQLEAMPETPEDMADALIAKGCTGQLELLASTLM